VASAEVVELDSDRVEKGTAVEGCRTRESSVKWRHYMLTRIPSRANTSGDVAQPRGTRPLQHPRAFKDYEILILQDRISMADVGALIVHGMGTQDTDFARPLITALEDRLADLGIERGAVAWQPGYWADLLISEEDAIWNSSLRAGPLSLRFIRQFVLNALGDAVAYRRGPAGDRSVYDEVQDRMMTHLEALRLSLGNADKPLVVIAHSLGSTIMSDYIWNAQANNRWSRGRNDFECMRTLAGFITFGSNIPLFSLALPKIEAITFPPPELPPPLRDVAAWHNYYDKDDVLGWPLKTLSPSYEAAVAADHEINVGDWRTSWNPASHVGYWDDRDFTEPAADQLAAVVRAARQVA
jgi:hypothetical protein